MTALADILRRQIRLDGPISVASYMQTCLLHPRHGYYTTHAGIGRAGDFITAPEISQIFGEMLGLCLAQTWLDQGAPNPFTLAELGPGRGTLLADMLRATRQVPGFHAAMQVHLVEVSPVLRDAQATRLGAFEPAWSDSVEGLPEQPLFLVANEFFDALPVRQFLRDGDAWRERVVGLEGDNLVFGLTAPLSLPELDQRLADTRDGDMVEICPSAAPIAVEIGRRISAYGGGALVIDYGDWLSLGDSFQAVSRHRKTDPLAAPGEADLTAHVAFSDIAGAAPCAHGALTPQGVFLERLGITARAQALATQLGGNDLDILIAAHRRLTHPEEMGTLFKVLGLTPEGSPPLPGLTE